MIGSGKNLQNTTKVFYPICDPQRHFFNIGLLSLLYPYGALTSCKKLEKTNDRSSRYSKTDGLLWTPSGKPGVKKYEDIPYEIYLCIGILSKV